MSEDCTQHKLSGLWDLNTQDDTVAQGMADLLKQTVADGADGFRYDAAKHIELSDEVFGGKQSHYWDAILKNGSQYQYGEVLEDANVREADYANLFNSSSAASPIPATAMRCATPCSSRISAQAISPPTAR